MFYTAGGHLTEILFLLQLHMLGDGSRGAIIEMTLAKVQYVSSKCLLIVSITQSSLKLKTNFLLLGSFSFFSRNNSDNRDERHSGEYQRPADVSEG